MEWIFLIVLAPFAVFGLILFVTLWFVACLVIWEVAQIIYEAIFGG